MHWVIHTRSLLGGKTNLLLERFDTVINTALPAKQLPYLSFTQ